VKSAAAGEPTLGAGAGWRAVVHTAGVPPWWLERPREPFATLEDVVENPGVPAILGALAILAWLALAVVLALRRRRVDVAAAATQGLALSLAAGMIAAGTPSGNNLFGSIAYTLWWAAPAGLFAWLAAVWSAVVLLPGTRRPALPVLRLPAVGAGLVAVAVTAVLVAARTGPERLQTAYQPIREIGTGLAERLADQPTQVEIPGASSGFDFKFDVEAALAYELRRRGVRVYAADLILGSWYDPQGERIARRVRVRDGASALSAGEELVARFKIRENRYHPGKPQVRDIAVTVTP
jgi:hypothetical protein